MQSIDWANEWLKIDFYVFKHFQSHDLEDWETQEATMSVCMCVSVSQKIIAKLCVHFCVCVTKDFHEFICEFIDDQIHSELIEES